MVNDEPCWVTVTPTPPGTVTSTAGTCARAGPATAARAATTDATPSERRHRWELLEVAITHLISACQAGALAHFCQVLGSLDATPDANVPLPMDAPTSARTGPLPGARGTREWYGLEERHRGLLAVRVLIITAAACVAAAAPQSIAGDRRWTAIAICVAAVALHSLLGWAGMRRPTLLRAAVDAALVVDAVTVLGLSLMSGDLESAALWLIPLYCLAATLGLSGLTGAKAWVLMAVAAGAVATLGAQDLPLSNAVGPLGLAAAAVAIAAAMTGVNERELRRRGERLDALHDAETAFVAAADDAGLAAAAEDAGRRLLPGWDVRMRLDLTGDEAGTWRDGEHVHLSLPIAAGIRGTGGASRVHGTLRAVRTAPRARPATLRRQQLVAVETLCTALAVALEQVELVQRLEHLSLVDPLTGLGNRRAFDEALEMELARARRHGQPLGLIMLDVDHFKRFNDTHGHQAGDRALAAVGTVLRERGRREDRACRVGGEEFAVLLPGAGDTASAEVAERIRRAIAAIRLPEGPITVSLGTASTGGDTQAHRLVAEADICLYAAKAQGRNRVVADLPAPLA